MCSSLYIGQNGTSLRWLVWGPLQEHKTQQRNPNIVPFPHHRAFVAKARGQLVPWARFNLLVTFFWTHLGSTHIISSSDTTPNPSLLHPTTATSKLPLLPSNPSTLTTSHAPSHPLTSHPITHGLTLTPLLPCIPLHSTLFPTISLSIYISLAELQIKTTT